jgi:hypothetical protein
MKTAWVCVLALSSIVAYAQIAVALSDEDLLGAIAFDAFPGRSASGSTRNDDQLAPGLAEYVFLHKTRDERVQLPVAARANVCPE